MSLAGISGVALTLLMSTERGHIEYQGRATVRVVDQLASQSRRSRFWLGSARVVVGVSQVALGSYGLASPRFSPVMRRSAIAQLLFGVSSFGLGAYSLLAPSGMEKIHGESHFAKLKTKPGDQQRLQTVSRQWRRYAKRARVFRTLSGAGYILGGVGLTTLVLAVAAKNNATLSQTERLWAYTTVGGATGLILKGTIQMLYPSPIERGFEIHQAVAPEPGDRRARPRASATWSCGVQGCSVSGRF